MAKFQIRFRDLDNLPIEVDADRYNTNAEAAVFRDDDNGSTVAYVPLHNVLAILTVAGETPPLP